MVACSTVRCCASDLRMLPDIRKNQGQDSIPEHKTTNRELNLSIMDLEDGGHSPWGGMCCDFQSSIILTNGHE